MDSTNKAIYQTTIGTFLVAFGVYGYECFVAKTVPFKHALPPFIVAGTLSIPSFSPKGLATRNKQQCWLRSFFLLTTT
jgi:arginine utilization protein RocB